LHSPAGCSWSGGRFEPKSDRIVLTQACGRQGPDNQTTILEVSATTGTAVRTLVAPPKGQSIGVMAIDASARNLIYATIKESAPTEVISRQDQIPIPQMWLWSDGATRRLPAGENFSEIAW
jgi:hypothetical protein